LSPLKKRLQFIFLIAAVTACGIILCQLYWVYFNYKTRKENFIQSANYALKHSVDQYQLAQNKLPTSLKHKNPTLTFFMRTLPDNDPMALDTPDSKRRFSAEFATVAVDRQHLPEVMALVGRLLSQQKHIPLNLDTLTTIFNQQLQRNNINQHFRLYADRDRKVVSQGQIAAIVNFYRDPVLIRAEMIDGQHYLMTSNFLPALVSSLMVLLTAGSLYYMSRIIKRQMMLDTMKSNFINNITHQLRTPVTILKSSNEALANFGAADDSESLGRYLRINASVLDTLDTDIERMLEFSRSEEQKQTPVYEKVMLFEAVQKVSARFGMTENLDIQIGMDTSLEIMTDPYMLGIILVNLVDNAIKYSPGAAQLEITAEKLPQSWNLVVRDQGQGIPGPELPYIFDKFYRVSAGDVHEVKGYGIGLAHVRQLVTAMNGNIRVFSELDRGTTFKLTFEQKWKR
jgi:two-component system phosphate regulon sensor histidine kinase PhoR